jgi:hypothetical protein
MKNIAYEVTSAEKLFREGNIAEGYLQLRKAAEELVGVIAPNALQRDEFGRSPDRASRIEHALLGSGAPEFVVGGVLSAIQNAALYAHVVDMPSADTKFYLSDLNNLREAVFWYLSRRRGHVNVPMERWQLTESARALSDEPEQDVGHAKNAKSIFLCHAKEDEYKVQLIYSILQRRGHKPWMDIHSLLPGQEWEPEIERAIKTADYFVACLSRHSVNKRGFVQRELRFALDVLAEIPPGKIYLIPVRLEPCDVPETLTNLHWLDIASEGAFKTLFATIELNRRGA